MQDAGWFPFCEKLQGHNEHVTRAFIKNYSDEVVWFEDLHIIVNEETIADAIGVSYEGEKWFKQQSFKVDFSKYLFSMVWKGRLEKWYTYYEVETYVENTIGDDPKTI